MTEHRRWVSWIVTLGAALASWPTAASASADDQPVHNHEITTTADAGPGSLRSALEESALTPGPDRITFGDEDGPFSTPQTIELAGSLPAIAGEVTIDGHIRHRLWKAYGATISGGGRHRVFQVPPGATLRLAGITIVEGKADAGGAVLNRGRLVVEGVSLLRNEAAGSGGAIANDGGEVLLINSTAADNRAVRGGAVANLGGRLRVTNSTLYQNQADEGAALYSMAALEMANSILAGGQEAECVNTGPLADATTHNLITTHRGCGEPILSDDPGLGAFGYYNGPTPVFTLEGGSPAINLGDNAAAVGEEGQLLKWDQRGNGDPRFAGGFADLGAFEYQSQLPDEFFVDTVEDTGLRGCSIVGVADCPLRAALELAAAARHETAIRFDPTVFSEPRTLHLGRVPAGTEVPLILDGAGSAGVRIVAPGARPPWQALNGVHLEFEAGLSARSGRGGDEP